MRDVPARELGLIGRNIALQAQCVVILAPKRDVCPKQKAMASEGVLWLDCTIGQQLSCSVPQDGNASSGNQESLGGKRQ